MDYQQTVDYCLSRPDAAIDYPFGPDVAVFKVKNKMFGLLGTSGSTGKELGVAYADCAFINLKCDPEESIMLRDIFPEILPGYHMSKKHWISIVLVDSMPEKEIERLIDRSYGLVAKGLKKAERLQLEMRYSDEELYR